MKSKKLMLLGGSRYLSPVIKAARQLGAYVITCDYLPDNYAHKLSDEYCNISIINKEAVLNAAMRLEIDGIMSFACDPGVVTAAYVQEKMGLPGNPYESVAILQQKDLFRDFLTRHNFNVPKAGGFSSFEEVPERIKDFRWPLIVKPVDAAGSKGITVITSPDQLNHAFSIAMQYSIGKRVVIEEFIEKVGCSTDSDCFSVDGKLVFVSYSAQRFDECSENPYAPAAFSWPSTMTEDQENILTSELQRLLTLLNMRTSIYNVEARVGTDGKVYIMEVSPRGGGNRLAEMVRLATGGDMITAAVIAALGGSPEIRQREYQGHWAEVILHSQRAGRFVSLDVCDKIKPYVHEIDLWVNKGQPIEKFRSASQSLGTMILKFPDSATMEKAICRASELYNISTEE